MSEAQRFELFGPLPTGTTVLEASAGTGKTYAIVGLAARFVAEGVSRSRSSWSLSVERPHRN